MMVMYSAELFCYQETDKPYSFSPKVQLEKRQLTRLFLFLKWKWVNDLLVFKHTIYFGRGFVMEQ